MKLQIFLLFVGVALAKPRIWDQMQNSNWWQILEQIFRPGNSNGGNQGSVPASSNGECGKSAMPAPNVAQFIVGGQEAPAGAFPWQVALHYGRRPSKDFFCGGSHVPSTDGNVKVLTACHCVEGIDGVKNPTLYVTFGLHKRSDTSSSTTLRAAVANCHPDYNRMTLEHDIAVIEFNEKSSSLPNAMPVCLPQSAHSGDEWSYVSGWGTTKENGAVTNELMYVAKQLLTLQQCKDSSYGEDEITENMLCAGETDKDACQGDSGSALVANRGGVYEQVGVVSWGYGCGRKDYPGVYANVHYHKDWLQGML